MKDKSEIVSNWLPRYTGVPLEQFGKYVLLTNFSNYVELFAQWHGVEVQGVGKAMPSAHADGLSIINFGMGSPTAATVMDLLSAIMPKAVLFLGKCGGLKRKNRLGDLILPIAAVRGLWVGPYYAEVFGATADEIGQVTLWMGLAMVLGSFAYGPLERVFGTRKGLIMVGNVLVLLALIGLWGMPLAGGWVTLGLFVLFGLAGTSFPMVIAHGRAFLPAHLTGRGVTLLNLFGIGAVGVAQFITGRLSASVATPPVEAPYAAIFGFFALTLALALVYYATSQDRTD